MSFIGLAPLGALMVGALGEHLGVQTTVVICGALSLGCALLLLTRLNLIREAQEEAAAA
jgi:predicted MFS family arabinose efflux permease